MQPTDVSENDSSSGMLIIWTKPKHFVLTCMYIQKDQITNVILNDYILKYSAQWRSSAPKSGGGAQTFFPKSEKQKKKKKVTAPLKPKIEYCG